jgi:GntR family transcriptional regulator/MocR family aminotransferase
MATGFMGRLLSLVKSPVVMRAVIGFYCSSQNYQKANQTQGKSSNQSAFRPMTSALAPFLTLGVDTGTAPVRQLAVQLRRAIAAGDVPAGSRLPPSRDLAAQLGIGRSTVVDAYGELTAEGWLEGRGRRGTFVTDSAHQRGAGRDAATHAARPHLAHRLGPPAAEQVQPHMDWRLGQAGTLAFPLASWRAACKYAGRALPPADYGDPRGEPCLREAIATWLGRHRALQVSERQVFVTHGAAQALDQIAQLLLRPGDAVVVENPGYRQAAQIFGRYGATVRSVPVDGSGMDVEAAFAAGRVPALVHVTAAHQYPLGFRLSGARRQRLMQLARQNGALILENEYDHEFVQAGPNHAPLFASAPRQTVLVSTLAKAVSPSLRVGFVVASESIVDRLCAQSAADKRQVSWPVQRVAACLLASGELDKHLRRVRRHDAHLRALMTARLKQWPQALEAVGEGNGQHVLLRCATARKSMALQRELRRRGVWLDPLPSFCDGPCEWHGVLLSYGPMNVAQFKSAMDVLEAAAVAAAGGKPSD